jgi:hypothetical protein
MNRTSLKIGWHKLLLRYGAVHLCAEKIVKGAKFMEGLI